MRLLAIAVYSLDGRRRIIELRPDGLTVITGESGTGKSALLDIVEYCLGRTRPGVPEGVITQSVAWYGLLAEHAGTRVFFGRPAPRPGAASARRAMVIVGGSVEVPDAAELTVNSDTDGLRDTLTRLLEIEENEQVPGEWALRPPLEATAAHALFYCFQRQSEIANRDQLFHRQNEEGVARAIRDTLPYFLGAVQAEEITVRRRLVEARRDLRRAERDLAEARRTRLEGDARLAALTGEAVEVGLLDPSALDAGDRVGLLREAARRLIYEDETNGGRVRIDYQRLAQERAQVRDELRTVEEEIELLKDLGNEHGEFSAELVEQHARLRTLDLFPAGHDAELCPLCHQALERPDPDVETLRSSAQRLAAELEGVQGLRPRRERLVAERSDRTLALRIRLRDLSAAIRAIAQTDRNVAGYREQLQRRAYVQGRITQFFEAAVAADEPAVAELELRVERLSAAVDELEAQLDPASERDRTSSRLNLISENMTVWARELQLEHSEGRARIDLQALTVVADTEGGPVPLQRMGSAANWVGYHIVAHLGLHQWFVEHDRPIPRFLMLDQPTQAFYPPDVRDAAEEEISDADRAAVHALFELIDTAVGRLGGRLQVIVTDHANLEDPWFQDAVTENWRGGSALIPADWPLR